MSIFSRFFINLKEFQGYYSGIIYLICLLLFTKNNVMRLILFGRAWKPSPTIIPHTAFYTLHSTLHTSLSALHTEIAFYNYLSKIIKMSFSLIHTQKLAISAHKAFYYSAQKHRRIAQQRPKKAIQQANLTVQIHRHFGIIPHIKTKLHVYYHTDNKLGCCYNKTAKQAFYYQLTAP